MQQMREPQRETIALRKDKILYTMQTSNTKTSDRPDIELNATSGDMQALNSVAKWSFHLARNSCFSVIIVLLSATCSCFGWFTLGPHKLSCFSETFQIIRVFKCLQFSRFCQLPFIFEFSASLSEKLTAYSISSHSRLGILTEHVIPG